MAAQEGFAPCGECLLAQMEVITKSVYEVCLVEPLCLTGVRPVFQSSGLEDYVVTSYPLHDEGVLQFCRSALAAEDGPGPGNKQ